MNSTRFAIVCALAGLAVSACTDTESATNLKSGGPPMIEQVLMNEAVIDVTGNETDNRVFAFGTLPSVDASIEHPVTSAQIIGQRLRIVFGELLLGNNLETISCLANVNNSTDPSFGTVPIGATPDDIAKCAVAPDVLKASCKGDHAVCICELDGGCIVGSDTVAKGDPVGVKDVNMDGAADEHHFIASSTQISCTNSLITGATTQGQPQGTVLIAADPLKSYWYPSGDQEIPATGGFEAIGPAIVFYPASLPGMPNAQTPLPSNTTCGLVFDPSVTDKTNIRICAPQGGRTTACAGNLDQCQQTCTAGDTSAFTFKTAPLSLLNNSFNNNDVGVDRTQPILLIANTEVDSTTVTPAISMTQGGATFPNPAGFTVTSMDSNSRTSITITATAAGGFAANTVYTLTVSTALKDKFGIPLVMPITYTFTTGA
jgi:hypothetical protein